jgi:hypothetical protein
MRVTGPTRLRRKSRDEVVILVCSPPSPSVRFQAAVDSQRAAGVFTNTAVALVQTGPRTRHVGPAELFWVIPLPEPGFKLLSGGGGQVTGQVDEKLISRTDGGVDECVHQLAVDGLGQWAAVFTDHPHTNVAILVDIGFRPSCRAVPYRGERLHTLRGGAGMGPECRYPDDQHASFAALAQEQNDEIRGVVALEGDLEITVLIDQEA